MNIKKSLGKRIKDIRKYKNITQERLAELIEVDTSSISNIENGRAYPTAENLEKIISVLDLKFSDIFSFDNFPQDKNELIQEMVKSMQADEDLTKLMYKFYSSVKF